MTNNPLSGQNPGVLGGRDPDEEGTDELGGPERESDELGGPEAASDELGGPDPGAEGTDLMGGADPG